MTEKEKCKILEQEVDEMYDKFFQECLNLTFKSETESVEYERVFLTNLQKYIKKRKKELGINTK